MKNQIRFYLAALVGAFALSVSGAPWDWLGRQVTYAAVQGPIKESPGRRMEAGGFYGDCPRNSLERELLTQYGPEAAPAPGRLLLKPGDRLAICGDSITEQKMYSRIIEDYLTMCMPQLGVEVRQYGWSGERAPGFLARMTNDCLRFKPAVATTCYGMNDHEYRKYEEQIGNAYEGSSAAIIEAFKANGVRVVHGSPGCVGKVPGWTKHTNDTLTDLNMNLCRLRDKGVRLARGNQAAFADVYWPMLNANSIGRSWFGTNYAVPGKDGVHPGWAGQTVMAYAFLKALGVDGEIGILTVNVRRQRMTGSEGHTVTRLADNYEIRSTRYPFCACVPEAASAGGYPVCGKDPANSDSSIRSGMALVPFNRDLNRFILKARGVEPGIYRVTWGSQTKTFSGGQLAEGINLCDEFSVNPFCAAFARVDAAVAAKQAFETRQVKQIFHGPAGKADMEAAVEQTEAERQELVAAIKEAFAPVTHTIRIVAD